MSQRIKIFIGYGDDIKSLAEGLKVLINSILPDENKYVMTASDIPLGDEWFTKIHEKLADVDVGIFCLTKQNRSNPWMHYEAGIIANITRAENKIIPYTIGFDSSDSSQSESGDKSWTGPFSMKQATRADNEGTFILVNALHKYAGAPHSTHNLKEKFDNAWPILDNIIKSALNAEALGRQNKGSESISVTGSPDIDDHKPSEPVDNTDLLNGEETEILRAIYLYVLGVEFEADVYTVTVDNILKLIEPRKWPLAKTRKAIDLLKSKGYIEKCFLQDIPAYSLTDKGSQWNKKKT